MELGGLDLESTKSQAARAKEQESKQEQGDDVTLVCSLPGGKSFKHAFAAGTTVAYVKLMIANAHPECPMNKMVLKHKGKTLIDPLSLSDCGMVAGSEAAVEVVV